MKKGKTLYLDFSVRHLVGLRLSGFTFSINTGDLDLIKDDAGIFSLQYRSTQVCGKTAHLLPDVLVRSLADIYDDLPFSKVKITGYYAHHDEESLMQAVLKKVNDLM